MTAIPEKFPKIRAVYNRTNDESGNYTVNKDVKSGFDWVFDRASEVEAVEKIHGTNVSVKFEDGDVMDAATRIGDRSMNPVNPYSDTDRKYVVRGIQNSIQRDYTEDLENGWYFGELVGPDVHGNPYDLDEHLFVPFDWLRDKCEYQSYGEYSVEFDSISDWLEEGIFSLFYSKMNGTNLDEASVSNGTFVEGIVFVHPEFNGRMKSENIPTEEHDEYGQTTSVFGKLRRDMYPWYY